MPRCPCNPQLDFIACCKPYLEDEKKPTTPEALMRSRYTAYTQANIDYIQKTMLGKAAIGFNPVEAQQWSRHVVWIRLDVIKAYMKDDRGFVEFSAVFLNDEYLKSIHELSEFRYDQGQWYYVDGTLMPSVQSTTGRNAKCPCGSLKKFKNCHGTTSSRTQ